MQISNQSEYMTVFIEGLHRTTGLWSGYVEGVKVAVISQSKYHQSTINIVQQKSSRLRTSLLLTKRFLHPMMIAGPLFLM